mgnify:CR=1 FL=1|jgi:hypothetical protein
MKTITKLWIGLGILILLSPLGLILPAKFDAGSAWGEWGTEELEQLLGYVPAGLARLADIWRSLLPDYALPGQESAPLHVLSGSYILSAVVGVVVVVGLIFLLGKFLVKSEQSDSA